MGAAMPRPITLGRKGVFTAAISALATRWQSLRPAPPHSTGCWGIEEDSDLADEARSRGHHVECGQVSLLSEHRDAAGGIYLGNVVDELTPDDVETLLALCLQTLRPGGRVLIRTGRGGHDPTSLVAVGKALGYADAQAIRTSRSFR